MKTTASNHNQRLRSANSRPLLGDFASNSTLKPLSIKEARKKLGKKYQHLGDDQVELITTKLYLIAKETISSLGSIV